MITVKGNSETGGNASITSIAEKIYNTVNICVEDLNIENQIVVNLAPAEAFKLGLALQHQAIKVMKEEVERELIKEDK